MEDFIRLNLNGFLCLVAFLTVITIAYRVTLKRINHEYTRYVRWSFMTIILITALFWLFSLATQTSVNVLPQRTIDRDYTDQAQKSYQSKVLKSEKEKQ